MAAGKQSSSALTISYDDGSGTPRVMTGFVLSIAGLKLTSGMQVSTAFADTIAKKLPTGLTTVADWTMSGLFDDTATTGPHTMFKVPDTNPQGSTRTLTVGVGNSNVWNSEGFLIDYEVNPKAGGLTEYKAIGCQNTGAWS